MDLESTSGTVYASASVKGVGTSWHKFTVKLTTPSTAPTTATNKLVISTTANSANGAAIWFGATYLYPPSYQNSSNHLRIDLMQKLAQLKPSVFRVPGGNYLEGNTYATRFEWSNTVGPVDERAGHMNSAWGYWSTDGMGIDEYLQMAEEVGSQPDPRGLRGLHPQRPSDTGSTLTNDVTDAVNEIHYALRSGEHELGRAAGPQRPQGAVQHPVRRGRQRGLLLLQLRRQATPCSTTRSTRRSRT